MKKNSSVSCAKLSFSAQFNQRLCILGLSLAAFGCSGDQGWLDGPDYTQRQLTEPAKTGQTTGLTVLVSFPDRQFSEIKAVKTFQLLNSRDYTGDNNVGSLRDYYLDMSRGTFDLQNRVVLVEVPQPVAHYDDGTPDVFNTANVSSLDDITMTGPVSRLMDDVLCRLVTCGAVPASYREVKLDGVGIPVISPTSNVDFKFNGEPGVSAAISTRSLSFWPDSFIRALPGVPSVLTDGARTDIPNLEVFSLINLMYAGDVAPGTQWNHGLWARSVVSPGATIPNNNGATTVYSARPARVQIVPTGNTDEVSHRALVHETGHTLFDFPDLYDSGAELFAPDTGKDSSGIGNHGLMGSNPDWKNPPALGAPLLDRLGWATILDITAEPQGAAIELPTNGKTVARYCRPESAVNECYYIEARSNSAMRDAAGTRRKLYTPGEGLVIWHAQNQRNPLDFVVNNNEDGTATLHYEVALVQADGLSELENGTSYDSSNDYFKKGGAERFDRFTTPNSKWWDGTDSGLAIHSISAAGGDRMSFTIGRRPTSTLYVDGDSRTTIAYGDAAIAVGERRLVTVTPEPGFHYDIEVVGPSGFKHLNRDKTLSFVVTAGLADTYIKVRSFPETQSAPIALVQGRVNFSIAEGAQVTAFSDWALSFEAGGNLINKTQALGTHRGGLYAIGRDENHIFTPAAPSLIFNTHATDASLQLQVKAKPGFQLVSVAAYGSTLAQIETVASGQQHTFTLPVIAGQQSTVETYRVVVNAEPIPGYFCRRGAVETWDPTRIYHDIGDKIRYNDVIYASSVPRNFLRGNVDRNGVPLPGVTAGTPPATPANTPKYWSRFAVCEPYVTNCTGVPEYSLGGAAIATNPVTAAWSANYAIGDQVIFNGRLFEAKADIFNGRLFDPIIGRPAEVPGGTSDRAEFEAAETYADVDPRLPIRSNRAFAYPHAATWELKGNCSTPSDWQRATIAPNEGVRRIVARGSNPPSFKTGRALDPVVVTNISADWSFDFELDTGYTLEDVYIDGVGLGLPATARTASVSRLGAGSAPRPAYVEIRTQCPGAICGVVPPVPTAVYLEAECSTLAQGGYRQLQTTRAGYSGSGHILSSGSTPSGPTSSTSQAIYDVSVAAAGTYVLYFRAHTNASANDDSWFYQVDGGAWVLMNNNLQAGWAWYLGNPTSPVLTLSAGVHSILVGNREDGLAIDKLALLPSNAAGTDALAPTGLGATASNCPAPPVAICGNGIAETGEACDDGNSVDTDGCRNSCALPVCGDAICSASESCTSCAADCVCTGGTPLYLEAECGSTEQGSYANLQTATTRGAFSGSGYIVSAGATPTSPTAGTDRASYNVNVPSAGNYVLYFRAHTNASADDDSWFYQVDNGAWITMNNNLQTGFAWYAGNPAAPSFALTAGAHTIRIGNRENGLALDKLVLMPSSAAAPVGLGGTATNCTAVPPAPVCGNGIVEAGEACDDGNSVNTDTCTNSCSVPTATSFSIFSATFDNYTSGNNDGFTFRNDTFGTTATNATARGSDSGRLNVRLGLNINTTANSGAFERSIQLASRSTVTVNLSYTLTMSDSFENTECGEVRVRLGNAYFGTGGNTWVVRRCDGGADNGVFSFTTAPLAAGAYTLQVGGYLNDNTATDEIAVVTIDNVVVTGRLAP